MLCSLYCSDIKYVGRKRNGGFMTDEENNNSNNYDLDSSSELNSTLIHVCIILLQSSPWPAPASQRIGC